jgi:transcription elongation factor Elf1
MANYFMFGAIGQCPRCADHRFSGPPLLTPEATVTCHKCGLVCSVELAVTTALKSGVVKKLSDHRVVQGS